MPRSRESQEGNQHGTIVPTAILLESLANAAITAHRCKCQGDDETSNERAMDFNSLVRFAHIVENESKTPDAHSTCWIAPQPPGRSARMVALKGKTIAQQNPERFLRGLR